MSSVKQEGDSKRACIGDEGRPKRVFLIMEPVYEPEDTKHCLPDPPADRKPIRFAAGVPPPNWSAFCESPSRTGQQLFDQLIDQMADQLAVQLIDQMADVIVVHGDGCKDGLIAAAVARDAGFAGPILAWSLKDGDAPELKDKRVAFVDCCPEARHLDRWQTKDFIVIDHHPRAGERHKEGDARVCYKPDHCGASLLRWCLGKNLAPLDDADDHLVYAAVAGDTWIHSVFPDWDVVYDWMDANVHRRGPHQCITCIRRARRNLAAYVTEEDRTRTEAIRAEIRDLSARVVRRVHKPSGQGCWLVPCDNYAIVSRLGAFIVAPEARRLDIAVMHAPQADGRIKLMARAHVDSVLELARKFCEAHGGGGHGNAAGCLVTQDEFASMFV